MTRIGGLELVLHGGGCQQIRAEPRMSEAEASDLIPQLHLTSPYPPNSQSFLPHKFLPYHHVPNSQQTDTGKAGQSKVHLFLLFRHNQLEIN